LIHFFLIAGKDTKIQNIEKCEEQVYFDNPLNLNSTFGIESSQSSIPQSSDPVDIPKTETSKSDPLPKSQDIIHGLPGFRIGDPVRLKNGPKQRDIYEHFCDLQITKVGSFEKARVTEIAGLDLVAELI
jgi:hypothetical protein